MLQNIILLAPQPQQHFAIGALFRAHNPALSFIPTTTLQDLNAIGTATLRQSRLIAFTSGVIVPPHLLDALGHGAYNFHPGPPAYPGWAPAHFAVYEGARVFGATAHAMAERVDAGPIVGIETFIVPNGISVRGLEQITYVRLAYLLWRLANELATQPAPLETLPIEWSSRKSTQQTYAAMCDIPANISKSELDRRMKAFHDDFRGMTPSVTLHGITFRVAAASPATSEKAGSPVVTSDQPAGLRKLAYG